MVRKAIVILVALQGACTAGPDVFYDGPAFTLNARLADLPAGEISWAVSISDVDYGAMSKDQQPELEEVMVNFTNFSPLVGPTAQIEFVAGGGIFPQQKGTFHGELRFYRLSSELQVQTGQYAGTWAPRGYDLVQAEFPASFSPFGPSGPTVTFPEGYSWLRRTCGATAGAIEMTVVSTDDVVDFYDLGISPNPSIELSEQALVEGCRATVPTVDIGARVSLDRAQSLVWSADGASIDYLAPADPTDPTQSLSLRQLQLADTATSEIVTIPAGHGLQIDSVGNLFVGGADTLLRIDTFSAPAALVAIPVSSEAVVSPDGRWLAHYPSPSTPSDNGLRVWDIQSGADLIDVNQTFLGWSPDSTLAYWSPLPAPSTFSILSPAALGQPTTYGTLGTSTPILVWNTDGPLLVQRPFDWSIQSGAYPACSACFGLNLQNPVSGTTRPVLDASAGMIDIVPTPPVLGFMLVWARTCLGLYNTVCSYSLMRVDLTAGMARTVAVSANEVPVAVSPDNQSIAIAAPSGIYVKSLAQ